YIIQHTVWVPRFVFCAIPPKGRFSMLSRMQLLTSTAPLASLLQRHPLVMTALIDIDDYELARATHPSAARGALADVAARIGAALRECEVHARCAVVHVEPDAWIVTIHGEDAARLHDDARRFAHT